jgi:pimeloyl-[acyl-carrier protein] methyl ester esterase
MHVTRIGQGPDVVLLHGWGMHGGIFAPLVPALARRHTLHLVDLPGHGHAAGSGAPLALGATSTALLEALPIATWIGWSLGGLLALEAARRRPARVRALGLIAATPRFTLAPDWPHAVATEVFAQFERDLARDYRRTLARFVALECHGSDHERVELRALRDALAAHGEPDPAALADGLALLSGTDLREALPTLEMPALWLAGARDLLVPAAALEAAAARMPNARYACIAGGGHAPFIGHPEAVLRELEALLEEVAA